MSCLSLNLSVPHATIVLLSHLVKKCPHINFSVAKVKCESGMIDFLDDADKYMCKNRTAPSDLPASLLLCQI